MREKNLELEGLAVQMAVYINLSLHGFFKCEIPVPANNLRPNVVGYGTVEIGPDFGFYCPAAAAVYVTLPRLR